MDKIKMYAKCLNEDGTMPYLEIGKEYRVLRVSRIDGFGDVFFLLEDNIWYASFHFSVTYIK